MVNALDSLTWLAANDEGNQEKYYEESLKVIDESGKKTSEEHAEQPQYPATTSPIHTSKGYVTNLFASEKGFSY